MPGSNSVVQKISLMIFVLSLLGALCVSFSSKRWLAASFLPVVIWSLVALRSYDEPASSSYSRSVVLFHSFIFGFIAIVGFGLCLWVSINFLPRILADRIDGVVVAKDASHENRFGYEYAIVRFTDKRGHTQEFSTYTPNSVLSSESKSVERKLGDHVEVVVVDGKFSVLRNNEAATFWFLFSVTFIPALIAGSAAVISICRLIHIGLA
ncbi:hypothetical protein [Paraburkholderia dipogonis]|uniref:hypothetical protein n=1 Tax=Paraburkholderia dipogonis TaxID=1211383 RepID=UPI0038B9358D